MEGVNFPLIFYSFYGYFIRKGLWLDLETKDNY
jgi:hypothetical protein